MNEFESLVPDEGEFNSSIYNRRKVEVPAELAISETMTLLNMQLGPDADLWIHEELNEDVIDIAEQAQRNESLEARSKRFQEARDIAFNGLLNLYESPEYRESLENGDEIDESSVQRSAERLSNLEKNLYLESQFLAYEAENS